MCVDHHLVVVCGAYACSEPRGACCKNWLADAAYACMQCGTGQGHTTTALAGKMCLDIAMSHA